MKLRYGPHRTSTRRHRRLCARVGHRPGRLSYFVRTCDGPWRRVVRAWCPRCMRPLTIDVQQPGQLANVEVTHA